MNALIRNLALPAIWTTLLCAIAIPATAATDQPDDSDNVLYAHSCVAGSCYESGTYVHSPFRVFNDNLFNLSSHPLA